MATDIIARGMASSAGGGGGGGDLPDASKEGQVLTSNAQKKPVWSNVAPLADNLLANPINNDAMYSSGPTGGLADITTGEEAYLQEIKGMSIVWNQLSDGTNNVSTKSGHKYIIINTGGVTYGEVELYQPNSDSTYSGVNKKIYDLTLMFGGNEHIPFSLTESTEYPINGSVPAQTSNAMIRFQRLFANVDLWNAPYDAGTIKNVKVTKLVETGRNLWDASTMETTGLKLLAGYRYEIYLTNSSSRNIQLSFDGGTTWISYGLTLTQRADGKYISCLNMWYLYQMNTGTFSYYRKCNALIKSADGNPIKYVGFVHSGNYCLTSGTNGSILNITTTETVPEYIKHEFSIDGIDGLNGIGEVCDTKDMKRIESVDLSTLSSYMNYDSENEYWEIDASNLPSNMNLQAMFENSTYLYSNQNKYELDFNCDENNIVVGLWFYSNDGTNAPTGTLLYPLTEPVATGESAFEPIALKSGNTWVVDDMGSEYFIQPANTNCPVNQVSYYYENLKDKLQNLQEGTLVDSSSYDYSKRAIEGIKIGDSIYRLIPQGNINTPYSIAIGTNSQATGNNKTAVGMGAGAYGQSSTVLGNSASCDGNDSITIGYQARNRLPESATFDSGTSRTYHCRSPHYLFFRFEANSQTKSSYSAYASAHYLDEYVQNQTLTLQDGKYYISYTDADNFKTFSNNRVSGTDTDIASTVKGAHLVVKLSNDNIASLDLLPYDATNSKHFTAYGIASDTPTFVSAYIDADGCVVLTLPSGITAEEVLYTLK